MNTPAKDKIQQLTPEQQGALASLELRRFQIHQQLLKKAHSYFGRAFLLRDIIVIAGVLAAHDTLKGDYVSSICILALGVVIMLHVTGTNRRLDALLKLLDDDIKKAAPNAA